MATAPVLPFVPVDEYLRTECKPAYEYVDGTLVPKVMAGDDHSSLQELLILALAARKRELGLVVRPERCIQISPTRFRIPDLAVFTTCDKTQAATTPPLFTIEIISPVETFTELVGKLQDHLAMGVQTVIAPDPQRRTVLVARQNELLHQIPEPLHVTIDVPGRGTLTVDFEQLFADLD